MCNAEQFLQIVGFFEACGYDVRPYSGRGMYGQKCLGVECENPAECVLDAVRKAGEHLKTGADVSELIDTLGCMRWDSMGLGSIIYFPDVEWLEDQE